MDRSRSRSASNRARGGEHPGVLDRLPDTTLALLAEGYRWGDRLCRAQGADAARTRLLLHPTVLVRGAANARRFYGAGMVRAGAAPRRLQRTLFGVGGVQGLDGEEHRERKAMFLGLLSSTRADEVAAIYVRRWREQLPAWEQRRVCLLEEVGRVLTAAVCEWAAVPLAERDIPVRWRQLESLIDGGAAVGPRYLRGVRDRRRLERWLAGEVRQVRTGRRRVPESSALAVVSHHRGRDGHLLEPRVAAVELLNVLRPTVAIDRFVVWAALALHQHPEWQNRMGDDDVLRRFVLEVRRTAPFFPLVAARAARPARFGDITAAAGQRVLLDLYATDHHVRSWPDAQVFNPDRFLGGEPDPFELVPQGGGDHATGHRCAGEWVTTAVMSASVRLLAQEISYDVPDQDLSVDLRRVPARPASGFLVDHVRRRPDRIHDLSRA
jgi:fatty-acid peroxygenase